MVHSINFLGYLHRKKKNKLVNTPEYFGSNWFTKQPNIITPFRRMRCIFDWLSNKLQTLSISLVVVLHIVILKLQRLWVVMVHVYQQLLLICISSLIVCYFWVVRFHTITRVPMNSFHRHHHPPPPPPHRHRLAMRNSHSYHIELI